MCNYFVEIYNSDTEKAQKDNDHKFLDCCFKHLYKYINNKYDSILESTIL